MSRSKVRSEMPNASATSIFGRQSAKFSPSMNPSFLSVPTISTQDTDKRRQTDNASKRRQHRHRALLSVQEGRAGAHPCPTMPDHAMPDPATPCPPMPDLAMPRLTTPREHVFPLGLRHSSSSSSGWPPYTPNSE